MSRHKGIVYEVLMEKVLKEKLSKTSRQHLNTITEEKLTSLSIPSDTLQLTHRFTDEVVQALAPFVYRNTPLDVEWRERQCEPVHATHNFDSCCSCSSRADRQTCCCSDAVPSWSVLSGKNIVETSKVIIVAKLL